MDSSHFYDERYEFDAPKQYIDFNNLQEDDNEDSFFDCRADGESKNIQALALESNSPAIPSKAATSQMDSATGAEPSHMDTDKSNIDAAVEVLLLKKDGATQMANNLATIEAAANVIHSDKNPSPKKTILVQQLSPCKVQDVSSTVNVMDFNISELSANMTNQCITATAKTEQQDENVESMDTEVSAACKPLTRSSRKGPLGCDGVFLAPPVRHSPGLAAVAEALGGPSNGSVGFGGRRRSVSVGPGPRRARVAGGSLSAEERSHLAQFAILATDAAATRSKQEKAGRLLPTKPIEFKFATDKRLHCSTSRKVSTTADAPASAADFAKTLRCAKRSASVTCKGQRGPTKPQPFNLSECRKAPSGGEEQNKFISLAELNMKFYSQTPQRFRTKSKKDGDFQGWHAGGSKSSSSSSINSAGLTQPQSPSLCTRGRSRPLNHPTWEEVEEQQLQEALQNKFKPRPLNPKIFEPPKLNSIVAKKPVTIPEPFDIKETKKEKQAAARIVSSSFLEDDLSSVPHAGVPPRAERTSTRVQPFSFDTRDQTMLKRKQEKIQQVIAKEKEMAEFHAHPMPVFDNGPKGLPSKKPPSGTKLEPFDLQIDKRAESKKQIMEKELIEREQRDREQRQFHARPATVTQKDPFIPQRSAKPLTEISGFALNTEKRSEQRHEYDMHLKRKEDEVLARKRELEEKLRAEEDAHIAEERRRIVHKARPMPQFPVPQLLPSDRPVTAPLSPKFATDTRLRSARSRANVSDVSMASGASVNTTVTR